MTHNPRANGNKEDSFFSASNRKGKNVMNKKHSTNYNGTSIALIVNMRRVA